MAFTCCHKERLERKNILECVRIKSTRIQTLITLSEVSGLMAAGPFSALNIAAPVTYLRGRPPRAFKDGQKTISESRVGSERFTWSGITSKGSFL